MKTALILSIVVGATFLSTPSQAKDVSETATVMSMSSVPCGTKVAHQKETRELLCHEYVLRAGSTEYHVQEKEQKNADLLALGQQATFTIHKDRMRLHATTTKGKAKDFEFVVVSMTAAGEANPTNAPQQ